MILNLFVNNLYILSDIALSLDSFTLFIYLSVNNRLLTACVTVSTVLSTLFKILM